jgi:hypothetical protein
MIKTFDEFNNSNTIEEGLLDKLKARKQILEVQGIVADAYEKLIQDEPKKFNSGKSVMQAVKSFALDTYKKVVTAEGALTFSQWWEEFAKAHEYMLDKTVFNTK